MLPMISSNGKQLYYTPNKEDATFLKSYQYDLETGEEEVVVHGKEAATYLVGKSLGKKSFIYGKHFANTYALAYVKVGNQDSLLTPSTLPEHTVSSSAFVSESEIYLLTNYKEDYSYLAKFDLEKSEFVKVLNLENKDFVNLEYDKSSHSLYITSENGVKDNLYKYDLADKTIKKIELPTRIVEKLSVSESGNVYLLGRAATRPLNLYKMSNEEWQPLTKYLVPGVK